MNDLIDGERLWPWALFLAALTIGLINSAFWILTLILFVGYALAVLQKRAVPYIYEVAEFAIERGIPVIF